MEKNKIISNCRLVIIGGSAGSLNALMQILPALKHLHNFAIVIVVHRKSTDDQTLEELISLKSSISVKAIEDKTILKPGFVYIAPSNYHLLFEKDDTLALDISEKINYSRPSIDVSFESAADIYVDSINPTRHMFKTTKLNNSQLQNGKNFQDMIYGLFTDTNGCVGLSAIDSIKRTKIQRISPIDDSACSSPWI